MDTEKLTTAGFLVLFALMFQWLAREPLDPSQLTTVTGALSDQSERTHRRRTCFTIELSGMTEAFELCSTSFRRFEKDAFLNEVRRGDALQLLVVREKKNDPRTGGHKYWVRGIRTGEGKVYLDFDRVQADFARERTYGYVLSGSALAGAILLIVLAFIERSKSAVRRRLDG